MTVLHESLCPVELLLISTDVVEWTHFLTSIGISQAWPAYSCLQWLFLILLQFSLLAIRAMTTITEYLTSLASAIQLYSVVI